MYFKKLTGDKCYLSPIDENDAERYAAWLNDTEVTVNLREYFSVLNAANETEFLKKLSKEHHYSIVSSDGDKLIGVCGLMDIDSINQTAEAGIFIGDKNYWGLGYGTEALSLLLDYAFKALSLHNVMLKVYGYNHRARKSYEKIGFKRIGSRREALHRHMEKHDVIYMDILPCDFYANYPAPPSLR
jgi:RimJ/RimL family protein N-acetyltransferase